ncbi:MAG: hypothetical protein WBA99_19590, partial [Nodosilinea sp.]
MTSPTDRDFENAQPSWFDRIFRDSEGNIVIGQPPNLPVLVAIGATTLQAVLPSGDLQTAIELIAFG